MSDAERIERLERVLGTLIVWIGQSAGSPLGAGECSTLLARLRGEPPAQEKADEAE